MTKKAEGKKSVIFAAFMIIICMLLMIIPRLVKAENKTINEEKIEETRGLTDSEYEDAYAYIQAELATVLGNYQLDYKSADGIYPVIFDKASIAIISKKVMDNMSGYIKNLDYSRFNKDEFRKLLEKNISEVISSMKENLYLVGKDSKDSLIKVKAADILDDRKISDIAIVASEKVSKDFEAAVKNYLSNINSLKEQISKLNESYISVYDSITDIQKQVNESDKKDVELLRKLKEQMSDSEVDLKAIDELINQIEEQKASISLLNSDMELSKNNLALSVNDVRNELSNYMAILEDLKKNNTEKLDGMEENISQLKDICNGLKSDRLTVDEFNQYRDSVKDTLGNVTKIVGEYNLDSDNKIKNFSDKINEKILATDENIKRYNDSLKNSINVLELQLLNSEDKFNASVNDVKNGVDESIRNLDGKVELNNKATADAIKNLGDAFDMSVEDINESIRLNVFNLDGKINDMTENLNTDFNNSLKDFKSGVDVSFEKLQIQIDELKKSVSDGKSSLASAITNAGVTTNSDASFETMSENIDKLAKEKYEKGKEDGIVEGIKSALVGTADASKVLNSVTFTSADGIGIRGSMADYGVLDFNPSYSTTYTVKPGFYSGGTLDSSGAYNAGVAAADSRVNTGSESYRTGYDNAIREISPNITHSMYIYNGTRMIGYPIRTTGYNKIRISVETTWDIYNGGGGFVGNLDSTIGSRSTNWINNGDRWCDIIENINQDVIYMNLKIESESDESRGDTCSVLKIELWNE